MCIFHVGEDCFVIFSLFGAFKALCLPSVRTLHGMRDENFMFAERVNCKFLQTSALLRENGKYFWYLALQICATCTLELERDVEEVGCTCRETCGTAAQYGKWSSHVSGTMFHLSSVTDLGWREWDLRPFCCVWMFHSLGNQTRGPPSLWTAVVAANNTLECQACQNELRNILVGHLKRGHTKSFQHKNDGPIQRSGVCGTKEMYQRQWISFARQFPKMMAWNNFVCPRPCARLCSYQCTRLKNACLFNKGEVFLTFEQWRTIKSLRVPFVLTWMPCTFEPLLWCLGGKKLMLGQNVRIEQVTSMFLFGWSDTPEPFSTNVRQTIPDSMPEFRTTHTIEAVKFSKRVDKFISSSARAIKSQTIDSHQRPIHRENKFRQTTLIDNRSDLRVLSVSTHRQTLSEISTIHKSHHTDVHTHFVRAPAHMSMKWSSVHLQFTVRGRQSKNMTLNQVAVGVLQNALKRMLTWRSLTRVVIISFCRPRSTADGRASINSEDSSLTVTPLSVDTSSRVPCNRSDMSLRVWNHARKGPICSTSW